MFSFLKPSATTDRQSPSVVKKKISFPSVGEVVFERKPRVNRIKIAVKSANEIVVTYPWNTTIQSAVDFFNLKSDWVIHTIHKMEARGIKKKLIEAGDLFETVNYRYCVMPSEVRQIKVTLLKRDKLCRIEFPRDQDLYSDDVQERLQAMIVKVLRYEAKHYLPVRCRELADKLGYSFRKVVIKNNKTNWGSCSSLGNINLNLNLMRLPGRLIDFVIVHELVHTKIRNHGPQFKQTMRMHFPDYSQLEAGLKGRQAQP